MNRSLAQPRRGQHKTKGTPRYARSHGPRSFDRKTPPRLPPIDQPAAGRLPGEMTTGLPWVPSRTEATSLRLTDSLSETWCCATPAVNACAFAVSACARAFRARPMPVMANNNKRLRYASLSSGDMGDFFAPRRASASRRACRRSPDRFARTCMRSNRRGGPVRHADRVGPLFSRRAP